MNQLVNYEEIAQKYIWHTLSSCSGKLGENPVIYLDSGAIIQFENFIGTLRRSSGNRFASSQFYQLLQNACPQTYVTSYILTEIDKHCKSHSINGHREISCETMDMTNKMHKNLCTYLRHAEHFKSYDEVRRDVFWASLLSFPQAHKKCNGDRISIADSDLIAAGIDTRYSKGVTGVAILTTDAHISKTLEVLTGENPLANDNYFDIINPILSRKRKGRKPSCLADLKNPPVFGYEGVRGINLLEAKK